MTRVPLSSPRSQCLSMRHTMVTMMVTRLVLTTPGAAPVTEAGLGTAPRVAKLQAVPGLLQPCNHHHYHYYPD